MPRSIVRLLVLVLGLVVLAVALLPRATRHTAPPAPPPRAGAPAAPPATARVFGPGVGFHSRERWMEHFLKHGAELDCRSPEQYLALAQALRDRPAGGDVLEVVRADGVVTRFDRASGAFLAFDADGTIRTFFRPRDGEAYFRRQSERDAP